MMTRFDPERRTRDPIPIVVSLDAAHSMIALPVEAPVFQVSEAGYLSLRSYLRATIASEEPVGIVGNSRFCVARSSYHLFHHCHHYTAKGLREAGLPISMSGALTRGGFAKQLRRIMPLS